MSPGDSLDPGSRADRAASFEHGAAQYASTRPSYPDAAVDWLVPDGAHRVLDLAAGTGKLTERLVARGLDVVAVEPSDALRGRVAAPVPAAGALAGAGPRPLAGVRLDHAFADLRADADGRVRTVVRDPATGQGLAVWQERGLVHVYTGDGLARRGRAAIAVEPVETLTDAFNRPDCAADVRLEPGAVREFAFGVEVLA